MSVAARDILLLAGQASSWVDAPRIRSLVGRLGALGFAIELVCVSGRDLLGDGLRLVECPGLGSRWQRAWAVRRLRLGDGDGSARPALLHVMQTEMAPAGLALAEHWRVPYLQAVDEFIPPGGKLRLSRRWCRGLIVPGRELADDLVQGMGVPDDFVAVAPPGVQVPDGPSAPSGARVPVVGSAGPLVVGSGLGTFLNAARRVVEAGIDVEFVVAGQGPAEVDLRRRAERLRISDRVTFAPSPSPDGTFWKVLDVFCQPALVPTVGRTLALAMAHGVPAVASDIEGLRSILTDEVDGRRVPPGDSESLAGAILHLLADPGRARALGRNGRDRVAQAFDLNREAEALARAYLGALEKAEATGKVPPPHRPHSVLHL